MKINLAVLAVLLCCSVATARAAASAAAPDYAPLNFDALSDFPFDPPDATYDQKPDVKKLRPKITAMIPKTVKALDGRKVQITGFMLPLDDQEGGTKKFLLMRNQITCCFGGANRINEFIMVTMSGTKPAAFVANVPMSVRGTLMVGPDFEDGVLNGIYQMTGEEVRP